MADLTGALNTEPQLTGELNYSVYGSTVIDYIQGIINKPQINSVELVGNKSLPDIGVVSLNNFDIENMLT